MDEARSIRDFWFGPQPPTPAELNRRLRFWFGEERTDVRTRRDETIRARFAGLLERAANGGLAPWADGPRRRLSLIILLDQFPRNIYRGTPRAYAYDAQALQLTLSGMQSAADAALTPVERLFFYMPLQHAEAREVQEESVAAYRRLLKESAPELCAVFAGAARSAENHRAIIERFGRFPHRNAVLGRESTQAEQDWLAQGGASFGQ